MTGSGRGRWADRHGGGYTPHLPNMRPAGPLPTETQVEGDVLRMIYSRPDGNYGVAKLRDSRGREIVIAGQTGLLEPGMRVTAKGVWTDNPEHGRQFTVASCQAEQPVSLEGIVRYIGGGRIPGINRKFAELIVRHFGAQTLKVLDETPERVAEVPGIGPKRMAAFRQRWSEDNADRDARVFLGGLKLPEFAVNAIIAKYTAVGAPSAIRANPYRLARDISGIGFLTADHIAREKLEIAADAPVRLVAGVLFALQEAEANGHACLPRPVLLQDACRLLSVEEGPCVEGLALALQEGAVIEYAHVFPSGEQLLYYYLPRLYRAETRLAQTLRLLLSMPPPPAQEVPVLGGGAENGIQLNREQELACRRAMEFPLTIVTGGPGVGKTTVVSRIIALARRRRMKVLLAAPTGRAAKRLSESAGLTATTIHRMLGFDAEKNGFVYGEDKKLPCDMLIVDEVSMLDLSLAQALFAAVAPRTTVVLVGDKDQLPSVGAGCVLHDLLASGRIPVTELVQIYRQKDGSRIIENAHSVNAGRMPDIANPPKGVPGDFYFYEYSEPLEAAAFICRLVGEFIPKFFGYNAMEDVQVLSPMRRGDCGVDALNDALQARLNPANAAEKPEVKAGETLFRLGDRVMQVKNNYTKMIFNGEMGRIVAIEGAGTPQARVKVAFAQAIVEYGRDECRQLCLAYAVTIHKSQGSEFPVIVMPLLSQHYMMLQRNLLYTGMTRAKKLFVIVGTRQAISAAVRNNTPMRRFSLLKERLCQG